MRFLIYIFFICINLNASIILSGSWFLEKYLEENKNTPYSVLTFSMQINSDNNVNGKFSYVTKWGQKIEDEINFKTNLQKHTFSFDYDSNWGGKGGKVNIRIKEDCTLQWDLIKKPYGNYYAPIEALLEVDKIDTNTLCNTSSNKLQTLNCSDSKIKKREK